MTPAQATGNYDWVNDYPYNGGPTNAETRAAGCKFAQRHTQKPACADCSGPVPAWARGQYFSGRLNGLDEGISLGGRQVHGYGIGAPVPLAQQVAQAQALDKQQAAQIQALQAQQRSLEAQQRRLVDAFAGLTSGQQRWIRETLTTLHNQIVATSPSMCPHWTDPNVDLGGAVRCFQAWYNSNFALPRGFTSLRTDGVLDPGTVCGIISVTEIAYPLDFPTKFYGPGDQGGPWANCRTQGADPATMATPQVAAPAMPPMPAPAPAPAPAPVPAATPVQPAAVPAAADTTSQTVLTKPAATGMSTGAKVGIAVAGVSVVGGIAYAILRMKG